MRHVAHAHIQPRAVFDFVKRAGEEQRRALEALREGRGMEYAREKFAEDVQQVTKFQKGLSKSREKLARDLTSIVGRGSIQDIEEVLEELEEVLITSDLGVDTVEKILDDLRDDARRERLEGKDIKKCLKQSLVRILGSGSGLVVGEGMNVYMVIGANGMGKTTTIGKLALMLRLQGKKVLIAACDTFRAAAVEQVSTWAERAEVDVCVPKEGQKSPSSVLFSAMQRGVDEGYDVVIIDTSGRLHTNVNLMGELQKMVRVVSKFKEGGADEILLVVDASIGRNAVRQAETWKRDVGVSGLVVTKLDGSARAGFVVSCVDELEIDVKFVGVGEGVDDLRTFDSVLFVEGLVGE